MILKKHRNKNDYCLSRSGHWVRDFTKPLSRPLDINNLIPISDMTIMLQNETSNHGRIYQNIESENINHPKILIIGDGYAFEEVQESLKDLPTDVIIMGVNGTLNRWKSSKRINYYIINNPYEESLLYLQNTKNLPKCIASTRTYSNFLKDYKGLTFTYAPVIDEVYSGIRTECSSFIDDYRNPICAAISLSYKFKVKKLMIMSVTELYKEERPGMRKTKDDLWIYPQQEMALSLIDANFYWLQKAKIDVGYNDKGSDYEFATYISTDTIRRFFS
jgi:hypothetical protein